MANTTSLIRRIVEKQASQTARDMRHWRQAKQEATKPDMPKRVRLVDLINDLLYDTHLSSQMELRIDTSPPSRLPACVPPKHAC